MKQTERTQLQRLPERGSHDPEVVHAVLDAAFLAHVGFCVDQQPFVIPTLFGRDGDTLTDPRPAACSGRWIRAYRPV